MVPPSGASFLRPDVLPSLAYIDRVSSGGHAVQLGWATRLGSPAHENHLFANGRRRAHPHLMPGPLQYNGIHEELLDELAIPGAALCTNKNLAKGGRGGEGN